MKAIIKAVTAGKFTEDQKQLLLIDQKQILHRVSIVLIEHGFSVKTEINIKKTKQIKLKAI